MRRRVRSRLTYANVMATVAVFIALGGASYAAVTLPRNSVGSTQIKKSAVTGGKVKDGSLTGSDVKDRSLTARDFDGAVMGPVGPQGSKGDPGPPGPIAGTPAGGGLTGTYPNPMLAPASTPIDVAENPAAATDPCLAAAPAFLTFCGTAVSRWLNGGVGLPGVQVYRDQIGQVHLRGAAHISSGGVASESLFRLPPDLQPKRLIGDMVLTGTNAGLYQAGTALMIIYPSGSGSDGYVALFSPSNAAHTVVHFGDVTFRTDA